MIFSQENLGAEGFQTCEVSIQKLFKWSNDIAYAQGDCLMEILRRTDEWLTGSVIFIVCVWSFLISRLEGRVKLFWKLTSITKSDNGVYKLAYETPSGMVSLQSKTVIMTVPSYVASTILRPLSEVAADALSKFYYPPVAAVTISYPKEAIRTDCLIDGELKGFGQLHPRSQGVETLGTIYSSSLFPNRAPPGRILLLNYIGGATNPGITSKTESQLVETVDRDLRKMLINSNARDPFVVGVRVWPQAIPQFMIGHLDVLDTANTALSNGGFGGLILAGNYVSGVALGKCVEAAYDVAADVTKYLSQYQYV